MFRGKSRKIQETIIEEPKRPEWKSCRFCAKCTFNPQGMGRLWAFCSDTNKPTTGIDEWDRCDGFIPKNGCATCNKTKYCKIDHMNEVYADEKITRAKEDKCSSWVALPEIVAMLKHEDEQ